MCCLTLEQIYLYLEKELSPAQNEKIEEHLRSCLKCSRAVEERRILLQAAESLPEFDVPPRFAKKIMARIFPAKASWFGWLAAFFAAFSSMIIALLILVLAINQNLARFLLSFSHALGNSIKNSAVIFVKLYKLISLLFNLFQQLLLGLVKTLALLTTIISPEVQVLIITMTLILAFTLIFGIRRFLAGEKP